MQHYVTYRRRKEKEKQRRLKNAGPVNNSIAIGFWNANGFKSQQKQEDVMDIMRSSGTDLFCIVETHMRKGANEDMSTLSGVKIHSKERGFVDKKGGGIMVLAEEGLNHIPWEHQDDLFPELATEKQWILIHEGGVKLAVCFVYVAAEVAGTEGFKEWNVKLYASLQKDWDFLIRVGYECLLLGDLNGHVGNGGNGIEGNHPSVNFNGRLIHNFVEFNNLYMINADQSVTTGVFTRVGGGNATVLDYVLATQGAKELVQGLEIDEQGVNLPGSDHAGLFLYCKLPEARAQEPEEQDLVINTPASPDYTVFHNKVDEILDQIGWEKLDLEEKCKALQNSLIQAGTEVFGLKTKGGAPRRPRPNKKMTKLKATKKEWERRSKFRSVQMARMRAAGVIVPRRVQAQGTYCATRAKETKEQLDELQNKETLSKRQRTRRLIKLGSAGF